MAKVTLQRLIFGYVALPVVIFWLGWFSWWVAVPCLGLLVWQILVSQWLVDRVQWTGYNGQRVVVGGERLVFKVGSPTSNVQRLQLLTTYHLPLILLAFGWTYLAGVGGFRPQHFDYYKHNLIFNNLTRLDWPVRYADGHYLCYYLAYYLPAAGLAKFWGGLAAVSWYSFGWAWLGLSLLFVQLHRLGGWGFVVFFCFFNSPEAILLVYEALKSPLTISQTLTDLWTNDHTIELIFTPGGLVFPSHVESITAVPQHALGAWLVLSFWLQDRLKMTANILLLVCFLGYWSPFVVVGFVPMLVLQMLQQKNYLETIKNALIPTLLAVPALIYYAGHVPMHDPQGWWWQYIQAQHQYILLGLFWVLEVGIWLGLVVLLEKKVFRVVKPPYEVMNPYLAQTIGALVVLTALTLYRWGHYNDLARRSSMVPTMMLCWGLWQYINWRGFRKNIVLVSLWVFVGIGAILPIKHHLKWLTPNPYTARVDKQIQDFGKADIHYMQHYHQGEFDVVAQYLGKNDWTEAFFSPQKR